MNTNHVMPAASPAAMTRRSPGMAAKGSSAAAGKGAAFNDVLAKSQGGEDSFTPQDMKDLAKAAEELGKEVSLPGKADQGSEKASGTEQTAGKESGQDTGEVLEAVIEAGAAVNPLQEAGKLPIDFEQAVEEVVEEVSATDAAGTGHLLTDWPMSGQGSRGEETPDLQSLLPQSVDQATKHQQMLAMLSGQMVKGTSQNEVQAGSSPNQTGKGTDATALQMAVPAGRDIPSQPGASLVEAPGTGRAQLPTDPLSAQSMQMARNLTAEANEMQTVARPLENAAGQQVRQGTVAVMQPVAESMAAAETQMVLQPGLPQAKAAQPVQSQGDSGGLLQGVQITVEEAALGSVEATQPSAQQQSQQEQKMPFQQFTSGGNAEAIGESAAGKGEAASTDGNAQAVPAFQQSLQHANGTHQSQPASAQQVRDDFHVTRQIVEQARLIRSAESTEMVIRLKPEHLGHLTLRISVSGEGAVTASFFSDNAQVRHIVENSLVQLRQELENQGIKVDKAEVYAGLSDGQLPQEQGQQAWQQQNQGSPSASLRSMSADMDSFEETAAELSVAEDAAGEIAADGVNYLV